MIYTITCRSCKNTFAKACSKNLGKKHLTKYHGGPDKVDVKYHKDDSESLSKCTCGNQPYNGGH